MADMLECEDARENITQTVTLSNLTVRRGFVMVWAEISSDDRTHLYAFVRGGITANKS